MKISQIRRVALALPEATEAPHFDYASFRVRGKIFATVPPDEKHLHVFVGDEERAEALARNPGGVEKLFWGAKVVGLRITLAKAKPEIVTDLLRHAWLRRAPKKIAAAVATRRARTAGRRVER
jgi:hypothetical protein